MARTETDREDLFAEAVALVRRAEFRVPSLPDAENPVVAGFHRSGRVSVYCGGATADHFDPDGRLLRAFRLAENAAPRLYRSQSTTLAELRRERTDDRTTLLRRDLSAEEFALFLCDACERLLTIKAALVTGEYVLRRVTPADPRNDLRAFLPGTLTTDAPLAPRFRGKR